MGKTIEEKYRESMEKGPDILSIKVKFDKSKVPVKSKGANMQFVSRGRSNKLGETSDYARKALTLNDDYNAFP